MKKILLIVLGVLVVAGLVTFYVVKQQSGYTKVLTAKLVRQGQSGLDNAGEGTCLLGRSVLRLQSGDALAQALE